MLSFTTLGGLKLNEINVLRLSKNGFCEQKKKNMKGVLVNSLRHVKEVDSLG